MNKINKIGVIVTILTIIATGALYGIWRGIVFLKDKNSNTLATTSELSPVSTNTPQSLSEQSVQELNTKIVQDLGKNGAYTSQYLATLPSDLPQQQILEKSRVEAFVNEAKGELLPSIPESDLLQSSEEGKEAVRTYINAISSATNTDVKSVTSADIDAAYRAFYADPQQSKALEEIATSLRQNITVFKRIPSPKEMFSIHQKMVSATQALLDNVALLQTMPKDFVGGLIGAKKIEELGPIFQSISQEITTLETKYGL